MRRTDICTAIGLFCGHGDEYTTESSSKKRGSGGKQLLDSVEKFRDLDARFLDTSIDEVLEKMP